MRALFSLACNEFHRVDLGRLRKVGKREPGPLKHLALACEIMDKKSGNIWFDMDYEQYQETGIAWTVRNVKSIHAEYLAADKLLDNVMELSRWFSKDMRRIREASALWRRAAIL